MHGIILAELEKFVSERHGPPAWQAVLERAGLPNRIYLTSASYPDAEVAAIVDAASAMTGAPAPVLLEAFGQALVPALIRIYGRLINQQWRTLEVLEHTEQTIHTVVRRQNPGANPARLACTRVAPNTVQLTYTSERKMCAVARGIIQGIAAHFGEPIQLHERECMLKGSTACRFTVRLLNRNPARRSGSAGQGKA